MDNRNYDGILWYKLKNGYWVNKNTGFQHVYIYEKLTGLKVFDWQVVHHLDRNKENNTVENLVCMTKADHQCFHNKTREISDETKERLRNLRKGTKLSDEHKKKIGEASKGRFVSKETREKRRLANIGKVMSIESRIKMSVAHSGMKLSENAKDKMRVDVQNIETGEVFKGMSKAANSVGVPRQAIIGAIKRKGKSGGYHWKYFNDLTGGEPVMKKGEQL